MKEPGADHPIAVEPNPNRVRVSAGGRLVAETTRALRLTEASYEPVLYVPREDAVWDEFEKNARTTHCPYKGEATYYDLTVAGEGGRAAVWSYEHPFPAVARIKDHLAFYKDKVVIEEQAD